MNQATQFSQKPSPTLLRLAQRIANAPPGPILDVPCGYGRNARLFAALGRQVICVDNNHDALTALDDHRYDLIVPEAISNQFVTGGALLPRHCDLTVDALPCPDSNAAALINVHYIPDDTLLRRFTKALAPGGFLFIETFNNQGENWRELPVAGFFRQRLEQHFELVYYKESKAGPTDVDAVTVRLFALKNQDV